MIKIITVNFSFLNFLIFILKHYFLYPIFQFVSIMIYFNLYFFDLLANLFILNFHFFVSYNFLVKIIHFSFFSLNIIVILFCLNKNFHHFQLLCLKVFQQKLIILIYTTPTLKFIIYIPLLIIKKINFLFLISLFYILSSKNSLISFLSQYDFLSENLTH